MYKFFSLLFFLCLIFIGASRTFELSTGANYIHLRADFPRFADKAWFRVEWGTRDGIEGLYDSLKAKVNQ